MTTRAELRTALRQRLEDTGAGALWDDATLNEAMGGAIRTYGARFPQEAVVSVAVVVGGGRGARDRRGADRSRVGRDGRRGRPPSGGDERGRSGRIAGLAVVGRGADSGAPGRRRDLADRVPGGPRRTGGRRQSGVDSAWGRGDRPRSGRGDRPPPPGDRGRQARLATRRGESPVRGGTRGGGPADRGAAAAGREWVAGVGGRGLKSEVRGQRSEGGGRRSRGRNDGSGDG